MIYTAKTYYPDLEAHIALVQSLKLGNTVLVYFTEIINIYKWMNSKRKHRPQLSWMLDLDFPKNTSIGVLLIRSQQLPHDFQCHTFLCKSANFKNHGLRLHNAFKIKLHRPQLVGFSKGTALPYLFQSWRCNFNLNSILQIYTWSFTFNNKGFSHQTQHVQRFIFCWEVINSCFCIHADGISVGSLYIMKLSKDQHSFCHILRLKRRWGKEKREYVVKYQIAQMRYLRTNWAN